MAMLAHFLGGIGLFLLGMTLMTDGLKLAAGPALETLLSRWTSTRLRGLLSGISITALVQSSSAVTVATLGFVNAGLLGFQHAIWVIFGSNVGTTLTAWLVALLGFSIKIDAYALPLIGIGAFLFLGGRTVRFKSAGTAIAGFGLLFLGIDFLKTSFDGLGTGISDSLVADGGVSLVWMVLAGTVLTVLTQSSSAAIALILTAIASELLPLEAGAAAVIGANIGTTSTAILASFGATANGKRLSLAHVLFNLITGAVALLLLPLFMMLLQTINPGGDAYHNPALFLAGFHTLFNLFGVLLMWPLGSPMTRWLQKRFRRGEKVLSLQHLDQSAAVVPDVALRAITLELDRFQAMLAAHINSSLLHGDSSDTANRVALRGLLKDINLYITGILKQPLPVPLSQKLPQCLLIIQYAYNVLETLDEVGEETPLDSDLLQAMNDWLLQHDRGDADAPPRTSAEVEDSYQSLKQQLLEDTVSDRLSLSMMNLGLQRLSLYKRLQEQTLKAGRLLDGLRHSETADSAIQPE